MPRYALPLCAVVFSAFRAEPCANMAYENRNQTDYGPLAVRQLRGEAVDQSGAPVPGVCLGLFRESDHGLMMATASLADGQFALKNPRRGEYRLVVKHPAFGAAN